MVHILSLRIGPTTTHNQSFKLNIKAIVRLPLPITALKRLYTPSLDAHFESGIKSFQGSCENMPLKVPFHGKKKGVKKRNFHTYAGKKYLIINNCKVFKF